MSEQDYEEEQDGTKEIELAKNNQTVVNTRDLNEACETIEEILNDLLLTPKCSKQEITKQEVVVMARLLRLQSLLIDMEKTENA